MRLRLAGIVAGLITPCVALAPAAAHATSWTVADAAELRAAITAFNASSDGIADVITLTTAGPYVLACGTAENSNADGDLDVDAIDALTITYAGAGRAVVEIDQSGAGCTGERVFDLRGGARIRLEHLTIRGGDVSSLDGNTDGNGGGVARLGGDLELHDVVVEQNRSADGTVGSARAGGHGGGVWIKNGALTVTDSIIRDNVAGDGLVNDTGSGFGGAGGSGGGIFATAAAVTLTDTVVEGNRAGGGGAGLGVGGGRGGDGGGIAVQNGTGPVTVDGGRVGGLTSDRGNRAGAGGSSTTGTGGAGGAGGGISGGSTAVSVTDADVGHNRAGAGAVSTDGTGGRGGDGGGIRTLLGDVTVSRTDVHDNAAGPGGGSLSGAGGAGGTAGAIDAPGAGSVTVHEASLSRNVAGAGGAGGSGGGAGGPAGALRVGGTWLSVIDSTVSDNAAGAGGGSSGGTGGTGGSGGAISAGNYGTAQSDVNLVDSLVTDNAAGLQGPGVIAGVTGNGGAIHVHGTGADVAFTGVTMHANRAPGGRGGAAYLVAIDAQVTNSTFDSNVASLGGAMYVTNGDAELQHATFAANSASLGASVRVDTGTILLARSVLAEPVGAANCDGTIVDNGGNVEHDPGNPASCGFATFVSGGSPLGPLGDHGGTTPTRLPTLAGGAVDLVSPAQCLQDDDQRRAVRPSGASCDAGAVELAQRVDAIDDAATLTSASVAIDVLANDLADLTIDPASVAVTAGATAGTTSVDPSTGVITYTPGAGFSGDTLTYEVCTVELPAACGSASVGITDGRSGSTTPFAFTDVVGVATGSTQTSNAITVAGAGGTISVTGGSYSVNGGTFTTTSGTAQVGDTVRVRHTAADRRFTSVDTTLTIGGTADTFTSTTGGDGATRYVPVAPERLFDTRTGAGLPGPGKIDAGGTVDVAVAGSLGIPDTAVAVVVNLTVTAPESPGFVTAYPRGGTVPTASTSNVTQAGQTRPNLATVRLDDDGYLSVYSLMRTHLLGDVAGYYVEVDAPVAGGRMVPVSPTRIFDTRPNEPANGPKGYVPAGGTISVQITGRSGVPSTGVSAVVLNVTATASGGANFVTVWPTGGARPLASSLNLGAGQTTANLVVVPVGADGRIDLYTLAGAHLLADVTGYLTDDAAVSGTAGLFVPLAPGRVFDTRPGQAANGPKGYVPAGGTISTATAGVAGIPTDAGAVVLNVTAASAGTGFVTGWPTGLPRPLASTLNLTGPGDVRANAAILPVGSGGGIDYFVLGGAHLIADAAGYYLP